MPTEVATTFSVLAMVTGTALIVLWAATWRQRRAQEAELGQLAEEYAEAHGSLVATLEERIRLVDEFSAAYQKATRPTPARRKVHVFMGRYQPDRSVVALYYGATVRHALVYRSASYRLWKPSADEVAWTPKIAPGEHHHAGLLPSSARMGAF